MKQKLFILFLFLSLSTLGQENKSGILFNVQLTRYQTDHQKPEKQFLWVSPGAEILYRYKVSDSWAILSGVNYSYSAYTNEVGSSTWKTNSQEILLPVILERTFAEKFSVDFGSYAGWLTKGEAWNKNKFSANKWLDVKEQYKYSESGKFTWDLFLHFKYGYQDRYSGFLIGPFVKYKLTDNWMDNWRRPFSFGVNLSFFRGL